MTNVSRRLLLHGAPHPSIRCATLCAALLTALFASSAHAQDTAAPQTAFDRQLERLTFSVIGTGQFSTDTNGTNYLNQTVNLVPSNTFGAIVNIRYTVKPYLGFEFNYGYARYTENFTLNNTSSTPNGVAPQTVAIQTNANEYTLGYVAHAKELHYGVIPWISGGAGSTAFRPTKGGGLNYTPQARATYFYAVGADSMPIAKYFGLRATFRQTFYLAPDYQTNYIRDLKRSTAFEPGLGFYIKF